MEKNAVQAVSMNIKTDDPGINGSAHPGQLNSGSLPPPKGKRTGHWRKHWLRRHADARLDEAIFFESIEQASGSLLRGHVNIVGGKVNQYPVRVVTLQTLLSMIGHRTARILKIDIEGAE